MPLEIEAKFKVDDHEPVRRCLKQLGAEPLGGVLETNLILDRRLDPLRNHGCGLRVRTIESAGGNQTTTLTFKGPVEPGPLKSREEIATDVSDPAALLTVLGHLGFDTILRFEKRRESWRLDACRIELDEPPHIGLFVEIEGPSIEAIRDVQSRIGLGGATHVASSYVAMLSAYCDEQRITDRFLRVPDGRAFDL